MNTVPETEQLSTEQVKQKAEDYRTTIHALQAITGFLTWDNETKQGLPESKTSIGRRMDTSVSNKVSPSTTVTPDAVVQRCETLGFVVEAKKSLPSNNGYWQKIVDQLRKYDDDLVGWWTKDGRMGNPCVLLLLHASRATDFKNYLSVVIAEKKLLFDNPISIIEFIRSSEVKEFLFLRKHWGVIKDETVSRALERGTSIPIEAILAGGGGKKFYDSSPIVEHTMVVLWQDIFTDMRSFSSYDVKRRIWLFEVSIDELTSDLQRLYGAKAKEPRDVSFPRVEWIREAMGAFEKLELAKKLDANGNYQIKFKPIKGDLLEKFAQHRKKIPRGRKDVATQLPLFEMFEEQSAE